MGALRAAVLTLSTFPLFWLWTFVPAALVNASVFLGAAVVHGLELRFESERPEVPEAWILESLFLGALASGLTIVLAVQVLYALSVLASGSPTAGYEGVLQHGFRLLWLLPLGFTVGFAVGFAHMLEAPRWTEVHPIVELSPYLVFVVLCCAMGSFTYVLGPCSLLIPCALLGVVLGFALRGVRRGVERVWPQAASSCSANQSETNGQAAAEDAR